MKKLRLVKVVVQPTFVVDDGEHLSEAQTQPIHVEAKDWPAFSAERFPELVVQLEAQLAEAAAED